ncbi:MAG: NYN domain-containing protein [Candidatus Saccharimonadales bacterium]
MKIVYVDGQNFLFRIAETLVKARLIEDKNQLVRFNIRDLFEEILEDTHVEIRFYGTKIKSSRKSFKTNLINSGRYRDNSKQLDKKLDEIIAKSMHFADISRRIRRNLEKQDIDFMESGMLKLRDADICKVCGNKDFKFQEKGVDVGMAVDIVVDHFKRPNRHQVIVSSDTDIIPALNVISTGNEKPTYLGFSNRITKAIAAKSARTIVIEDAQIIETYRKA